MEEPERKPPESMLIDARLPLTAAMSLADSPFVGRLYTNYVPSDSEIPAIQALLVDSVAALARMDARIDEMEIALHHLKEQRELLKRPLDAHIALISPMRRTPDDVLREIFLFCLPSKHNALIDPDEAPMLLGRICSRWRSITYSTPKIWSSLHIPSPDYKKMSPNILVRFGRVVEQWLERSGSCPLSISFSDGIDRFGPSNSNNPILSGLLPVTRRLRHIALSGEAEVLGCFLRLDTKDLPLLNTLQIHSYTDELFYGHPENTNALQLSTLSNLSLAFSSAVDPLLFPVRWSQLTELSLMCQTGWNTSVGGLDAGGVLDILRKRPNLVRCQISASKDVDPDSNVNMSPITLPHLQSLLLGKPFIFPEHISCLILPMLSYLQYGDFADEPSNDGPISESCLKADIDPAYFTPSQLIDLLQCFPTISHLRLYTPAFPRGLVALDNTLLARFYTAHNALCPRLTHLTVKGPSAGFSDAAALVFVKARVAMPSPLQQFQAYFSRPMEVDIMPELQPFIAEGLQVLLKYPSVWKFDPREGLY